MKIKLISLQIQTRQTLEVVHFTEAVTFIYGPIGTGKSTVARLIDFCFGGDLEQTPAIQQEFVSVILGAWLGDNECSFERGSEDSQAVRVTWSRGDESLGSANAPLSAGEVPLVGDRVFNLSDLLFYLCDVEPIKVLQRSRDPDSPMIRLSFRDIWRYCYLDQAHLDSSFYRLEDPFRGRKSQDAMRFFTGLHSERLSQLQSSLYRVISKQQGGREAVAQIRRFMSRFNFGSEVDINSQLANYRGDLEGAIGRRQDIEAQRSSSIHPTDELRSRLRSLSQVVSDLQEAIVISESTLAEQGALRSELITAKVKAGRVEQAGRILAGVSYCNCPQCGSDVSSRLDGSESCRLCGSLPSVTEGRQGANAEAFRRELNDRIDQIADSIERKRHALQQTKRDLQAQENIKNQLDQQLQEELRRYDSAFVESIRMVDREIAMLEERIRSLEQLQEMPRAISEIEEQAGASQGIIDRFRSSIEEERRRLRASDDNILAIAAKFKQILVNVGFPGISEHDDVMLDPRNWKPIIIHSNQEWGFWDTGSGGKKTVFNVCYALAVHEVARERGMPVPNLLMIDSPTKNISDSENPELVASLYREIYRVASDRSEEAIQFVLIDSDLVEPEYELIGFSQKRIAGEEGAPKLISYYVGP
jgi:uncharacterized Zn finger protein (UPF0148 family)